MIFFDARGLISRASAKFFLGVFSVFFVFLCFLGGVFVLFGCVFCFSHVSAIFFFGGGVSKTGNSRSG